MDSRNGFAHGIMSRLRSKHRITLGEIGGGREGIGVASFKKEIVDGVRVKREKSRAWIKC